MLQLLSPKSSHHNVYNRCSEQEKKKKGWRSSFWRTSARWFDEVNFKSDCLSPAECFSLLCFLNCRSPHRQRSGTLASGGSTLRKKNRFVSISLHPGERKHFPLIWKTPGILRITHNPLFHRAFALSFDLPRSGWRVLFWNEISAVWKSFTLCPTQWLIAQSKDGAPGGGFEPTQILAVL